MRSCAALDLEAGDEGRDGLIKAFGRFDIHGMSGWQIDHGNPWNEARRALAHRLKALFPSSIDKQCWHLDVG